MQDEYENFIPIGNKEAKAAEQANTQTIFKNYGRGVATTRDSWAYNFDRETLVENMKRTINAYNEQVYKWTRVARDNRKVDSFVTDDITEIIAICNCV